MISMVKISVHKGVFKLKELNPFGFTTEYGKQSIFTGHKFFVWRIVDLKLLNDNKRN